MSSITRAFEILEKFRQLQRPLSLKELVREFGYPSSSVADILKTLSHAGYISFDPIARTYFPTTRLGELGGWILTDVLPHNYPIETLNRLRIATGDTILLGTQNDLEVLYVAVLEAKEPNPALSSGRRTHRPLVKSGVGCALLSAEDDDFIERVYRRSLARGLCKRDELSLAQLMARIEACRRDGHLFVKDTVNPQAALVAMPVPAPYHGQKLAIGVGGPAARIEPRIAVIADILAKELRVLA